MTAEMRLASGSHRALKLAAIGSAAGLFSGLFGVGGGTVIVPLLVLWLGSGPPCGETSQGNPPIRTNSA